MPADVLDVVVEDVTVNPWDSFTEDKANVDWPVNLPPCCSTCGFSQPTEEIF